LSEFSSIHANGNTVTTASAVRTMYQPPAATAASAEPPGLATASATSGATRPARASSRSFFRLPALEDRTLNMENTRVIPRHTIAIADA
jgi:hypothetical protein